MGSTSRIEWTDATWNPVTGCSKISPGCANCYAESMSHRFGWTGLPWTNSNAPENVRCHPDRLEEPLRWRKPRRVFVCSMGDLFHEQVPDVFLLHVFDTMRQCPRHTFLLLTKRPERMRDFCSRLRFASEGSGRIWLADHAEGPGYRLMGGRGCTSMTWVWPMVTAENQEEADRRIPFLLDTPAAVHGVSVEPMLSAMDLTPYLYGVEDHGVDLSRDPGSKVGGCVGYRPGLDWVICGGESGLGARPMHPDWVKSLREQCVKTGVRFFFKQWGEWRSDSDMQRENPGQVFATGNNWGTLNIRGDWFPLTTTWNGRQFDPWHDYECAMVRVGKKRAGRLLDGRVWDQYPEVTHA